MFTYIILYFYKRSLKTVVRIVTCHPMWVLCMWQYEAIFLLRPSIPQAAQAKEMLGEGGGTVSYRWRKLALMQIGQRIQKSHPCNS
jgi:hypothetical protein